MGFRSHYTHATEAAAAARDLVEAYAGETPSAVVFFCAPSIDGSALSAALGEAWPEIPVAGCTTAGEFTDREGGEGGVASLSIPRAVVPRAWAALADLRSGAVEAIGRAAGELARHYGAHLRNLSPQRWVGVVLVDGVHGREEDVNAALGDVAPFLSFVGGSAGDALDFEQTKVFLNGEESDDGAVLVLCESAAPFAIFKTCSFGPGEHSWRVTRADPSRRIVYEVDGRPVMDAYAEALGVDREGPVDPALLRAHPLGIMIDGKPWIRSPQSQLPDGGLMFYCAVEEGMDVHVMEPNDIVDETALAMRKATAQLGGKLSGALLFNCVLRRLELDDLDRNEEFLEIFRDVPSAGFHTYGESWLRHINQTLTGILFGVP